MIENRSRPWSFQFIILPLLRDDSSALKLLLTVGIEGGAEKSGVMPAELREPGGGWGEKLLFSESPPASLTPSHTSSSTPTTFMDKLRGGRKRPSTRPGKVLTIFRQGSSPPQPLRVLGLQCHEVVGSLRRAEHHTELTPVAFVPVSRIRKTRAAIHIRRADVCLRCTSSGTNEKYAASIPVIIIFLERDYIPVKFSTSVLSSCLKITYVEGMRLNFVNQSLLILA